MSDTNFPTSKDNTTSLPNPNADDTTKEVPHAELHTVQNKAIIAVQNKIGTGASTPTANKVLMGNGAGTSEWSSAVPQASIDGLVSDLAAKANAADLATVATTGDYDDLSNTPTIPTTFDDLTDGTTNKAYTSTEKTKLAGIATGAEVNVQSDWDQTDDTADDYIENKPTIDDLLPDQTGKSDYVLTSDGTNASWEVPSGGGEGSGANLSTELTATTVQINSDTGTDALIQSADDTNAGILTSADKVKLDAITGTNTGDQDLSGLVPKTTTVNGEALSTDITLTQDDVGDGTTYKQYSSTEKTKLAGIEAAADVTDATNVAAAGAVMETDTSTADMDFVVDEDDMASNSATKLPTQQSTKAYVDSNIVTHWNNLRRVSGSFDISPTNSPQGVAWDGTYFYVTDGTKIYKYNSSGVLQTSADVTGSTTADHIADLVVVGGILYVACNNYPTTPKTGYIARFNTSLVFQSETQVSSSEWTGGVGYNHSNGLFYTVDNDTVIISEWNSTFSSVLNTYNTGFSYSGTHGWQGLTFDDKNNCYLNLHDGTTPESIQYYHFTGTEFVYIGDIDRPDYWATQGLDYDVTNQRMYIARRKTGDHEVVWCKLRVRAKPMIAMGTFNSPGSTGDLSVTGLDFTPKLVRFAYLPAGSATNASGGYGYMNEKGEQFATGWSRGTAAEARWSSTSACLGSNPGSSATPDNLASFVSMNRDGFTVNFSARNGTITFAWEAIG